MTHELKKIVQAYQTAQQKGIKTVLATVVALQGSSYRRPGVRMLILEDGTMVGAVSGGCVEKEVLRQAESVFKTAQPKMMTYDGRYRLGCEGILYILIEPFLPGKNFLEAFDETLEKREGFTIASHFVKQDGANTALGSIFRFGEKVIPLGNDHDITKSKKQPQPQVFEQQMEPCFKLMIIGAEHDAVQLCSYAVLTGWEVTIIATPLEEKNILDFPGAQEFHNTTPEDLNVGNIDPQTAVVVMTHNYAKDLKYLLSLKDTQPAYLGLLGPSKRREKLLGEFLEHCPEALEDFFNGIHGPAGLNIGAETPQEIAIAVISEILSVVRKKEPMMLKNIIGSIHVIGE